MTGDSPLATERFHFEGGVRVRVEFEGNEELVPFVRREIRRSTRAWQERLENSDGCGGMLTSHHQRDAIEHLPEPLNWLASQMIAQNEEVWLRSGKSDTYGAETVREQGLTNNQWNWIEEIAQQMDEADYDGSNVTKFDGHTAVKGPESFQDE